MTKATGGPVDAFSIGFDEAGYNELGYAELAARSFDARHHTYLVTAKDCLSALPDIVAAFDEPFGNASAIPTYFCARLARASDVDVLLAGDGGDELFGGNEPYAKDRIFAAYNLIPRALRQAAVEPAGIARSARPLAPRPRVCASRANMPGVERMLSFQFLVSTPLGDVFEPGFLAEMAGYSVLQIPSRHYAAAPARDHLNRLLYVDMKITLADNDLPKVTAMTDLAGVRPRFPFLDKAVASFAATIPPRLKVKGLEKRYLFKRAFRSVLPAEIIAKTKHGFGIPVAEWMKTDPELRALTHDMLFSTRAQQRGYFRPEFVRRLWDSHSNAEGSYLGDTLWTLLMIELWHERVVDASRSGTA